MCVQNVFMECMTSKYQAKYNTGNNNLLEFEKNTYVLRHPRPSHIVSGINITSGAI